MIPFEYKNAVLLAAPTSGQVKVKIYAGNLPAAIDSEELTALFSRFGWVYGVKVYSTSVRAAAEIEMDPTGARRAVCALNAQKLGDHLIRVHESLRGQQY